MTYNVSTVEEYLEVIPEDRKAPISKIRSIILEHIPEGFEEVIQYGMIGYVVPHSIYPNGYHCKPSEPLPFAHIASQKNYIGLYHSGIYSDPTLHDWFVSEYPKHAKRKLDMGKSCIRFKKTDDIPYTLIGELMEKITVENWIEIYENAKNKK